MAYVIQEGFALQYVFDNGCVICREVWRTNSHYYTRVWVDGELREKTIRISESRFISYCEEYHNA